MSELRLHICQEIRFGIVGSFIRPGNLVFELDIHIIGVLTIGLLAVISLRYTVIIRLGTVTKTIESQRRSSPLLECGTVSLNPTLLPSHTHGCTLHVCSHNLHWPHTQPSYTPAQIRTHVHIYIYRYTQGQSDRHRHSTLAHVMCTYTASSSRIPCAKAEQTTYIAHIHK